MGAVYETVILFAVVVFFGYGFSALLRFRGDEGPLRWIFQAFLFVVIGAYFVWFWSDGRRTLPMKTVSLQLVTAAGAPLTRSRALVRYLWIWALVMAPASAAWLVDRRLLLLLPVPFLWSLVDRDRRALYDILAGTRLVIVAAPRAA